MTTLLLTLLLRQLDWRDVILVTDNTSDADAYAFVQTDFGISLQHVHVSQLEEDEALSGMWLQYLIKTGAESWEPLHLILMCSLTCISATLKKASDLDQKLGSLSAFGMTSRWLLVTSGNDVILDNEHVLGSSMDNVANVHWMHDAPGTNAQQPTPMKEQLTTHTLMRTGTGRGWSTINIKSIFKDDDCYIPLIKGCRPTTQSNCRFLDNDSEQTTNDAERALFPNLRHGYNGRRLLVVAKQWQTNVMARYDNSCKVWSGFDVDFIQLASLWLNFTYDILDADNETWGTGTALDTGATYFRHILNKEVDIGLTMTDNILERAKVMDFAAPTIFSQIVMVYRKPQASRDLWVLFNPLNSALILAVVGSMVGVVMVMFVMEIACLVYFKRCSEQEGLEPRGRDVRTGLLTWSTALSVLDKVAQLVGAALVVEPSEVRLQSRPGRVLLWSWWMLCLVMTAAYSGTLTAFLSASTYSPLFSGPEDLLKASSSSSSSSTSYSHGYKWGWFDETAIDITLSSVNNSVYQGLRKGMQHFLETDPDVHSTNVSRMLQKVLHEDFVLITSRTAINSLLAAHCELVVVDAGMRQIMTSVVLPKGSALTEPLSELIYRLHANGIIIRWINKWFPELDRCPQGPSTGPPTITLQHMQGVMLILPLGVGLAFLVLGVEVLLHGRSTEVD